MDKLQHRAEFEQLLPAVPSEETKELADKANLTVLVGPFASGRNTIIDKLIELGGYHYVVSDTTRAPRIVNGKKEQNGKVYWFISEAEMLERLRGGKYIEAALIHNRQVSGISAEGLKKALDQDQTALTEIEIKGALHLMEVLPATLFIFIVPPDFETWMKRADARGEMDSEERQHRLMSAEKELEAAIEHSLFLVVVNDELDDAVKEVDRLVKLHKAGRIDEYSRGEDSNELLWRLLNDVKRELSS